ncbi:hypothetical protein AAVH_18203 [Aphelenchoides avenae]|nr:hypothetical protein AAVH_18203 [Aphelenchus avenae]
MRAFRIFLLLVVILSAITLLLADSISGVEKIRQKSEEYLNGPAYERIEKLPEISASVIEMYTSFGRLFLNGQLGTCERGYTTAPCTIRTKGRRDAKLWNKAGLLMSKIWGLKGEKPFNRSLATPTNDTPAGFFAAGQVLKEAQEIFKRTWQFYAYLAGAVTEALNASESRDTDLGYLCRVGTGWAANADAASVSKSHPRDDRAINLALHNVAPDCEQAPDDDYALSLHARYASNHGFAGGDSNKCLQNFVIRYNNYDEDAYKSFLSELHGYLFQDEQFATRESSVSPTIEEKSMSSAGEEASDNNMPQVIEENTTPNSSSCNGTSSDKAPVTPVKRKFKNIAVEVVHNFLRRQPKAVINQQQAKKKKR